MSDLSSLQNPYGAAYQGLSYGTLGLNPTHTMVPLRMFLALAIAFSFTSLPVGQACKSITRVSNDSLANIRCCHPPISPPPLFLTVYHREACLSVRP